MRNALRALLVPVAVAAATALPASTAHAADGYDRCPDGYYCMFSGLDGTGDMITLRGSTPDLAALGMNDRAKSDWNRTSSTIYLWSDANYTGCAVVTSADPTGKGNFYPDYRDFLSSVQFDGPGGLSCGTPPGEDG
ncbi:peptidase inhibitor family I36 protein [Streptomyces sp. ME19-01-6]|uniref:peptidase inhibitor family I36 protein n=1 Tax=Streptomyces sp. ME19-01-6 TaxID=3028686 RepID=UPI0029B7CC27|nr:peptidase inhibitor family I36 protein [Streptomyces sp. ME19-01-6]MDX3227537.1 peptidase inhibitor family I36 protein [Streptomyces sp. ME19-01-6]